MKYDFLIVGAGISGCTLAERIANVLNKRVCIIDFRDHIGGNCYDYKDENGIIIHKYGPHVFHTNKEDVWQYLSQFTKWHLYFHKVLAYIDNLEVPVPFNFNSIYKAFPNGLARRLENKLLEKFEYNSKIPILELRKSDDPLLKLLAEYVFEKIFLNYTIKQWGLSPDEIDESVTARIPVFLSRDDGYFQDKYQAIPAEGYTAMFKKMIDHPNIELRLNTNYADVKESIDFGRLIFTGKIEEYFDFKHGELPYRSLDFRLEQHDVEYFQSVAQKNYPNNFDFTRITEYKHFLNAKSDKTVISKEYSMQHKIGENDPYYPILTDESLALYDTYKREGEKLEKVYFIGRLAEYKYYNMDDTFQSSLALFDKIKAEFDV